MEEVRLVPRYHSKAEVQANVDDIFAGLVGHAESRSEAAGDATWYGRSDLGECTCVWGRCLLQAPEVFSFDGQ
jgi:hypothetical protein